MLGWVLKHRKQGAVMVWDSDWCHVCVFSPLLTHDDRLSHFVSLYCCSRVTMSDVDPVKLCNLKVGVARTGINHRGHLSASWCL